jgi:uncharacterized protein
MKRFVTICVAVFAVLFAWGAPLTAAASRPNEARPGLWKLSDADTTIYLFGTIHVLPKDYVWRTPIVEGAMTSSNELILEVIDSGDTDLVRAVFTELATSPGLPPVNERVSPKKLARLTAMMKTLGRKIEQMTLYESWAVSLILVGAMLADVGIEPQSGVEQQLTTLFKAAKKPISGLETTREQLGFFDTLSETAQRFLLASMIDGSSKQRKQFEAMISAWRRGDMKAISATFDKELKSSPELLGALLTRRNINWTDKIAKRLETPGTVFIAVGAGHLAGEQSVQLMLAKRGLKVIRVQ